MIRLSAPAHCLHLRMRLLEEITDIDVKWAVTVLGNYDHKLLLSLITSDSGHSGSSLTPAPAAAPDRSHPRLVGQGRARGNTDTCGWGETRARRYKRSDVVTSLTRINVKLKKTWNDFEFWALTLTWACHLRMTSRVYSVCDIVISVVTGTPGWCTAQPLPPPVAWAPPPPPDPAPQRSRCHRWPLLVSGSCIIIIWGQCSQEFILSSSRRDYKGMS